MTKTEKYFKEIQQIAINNMGNFEKYNIDLDNFLNTQKILKRNKIKSLTDKVKIYFLEYINTNLEDDYYNNNVNNLDVFTFLYYKISEICLKLKSGTTDSIISSCLLNKKDKINSIIIDGYYEKQEKIKDLEKEINVLKKGMV